MLRNLNLDSVWFDSGLKTFSKISNTASGLSTLLSVEDAMIWVACLPNQLINRPALCFSLRSHRGPLNNIAQSALNWPNSVNLSLDSQSKTGLENCKPPTLDISINYTTIHTIQIPIIQQIIHLSYMLLTMIRFRVFRGWSKITKLSHTHEGLVKNFCLASCTMHPNFTMKYSTNLTKIYMNIKEKLCPNLCWHSLIHK